MQYVNGREVAQQCVKEVRFLALSPSVNWQKLSEFDDISISTFKPSNTQSSSSPTFLTKAQVVVPFNALRVYDCVCNPVSFPKLDPWCISVTILEEYDWLNQVILITEHIGWIGKAIRSTLFLTGHLDPAAKIYTSVIRTIDYDDPKCEKVDTNINILPSGWVVQEHPSLSDHSIVNLILHLDINITLLEKYPWIDEDLACERLFKGLREMLRHKAEVVPVHPYEHLLQSIEQDAYSMNDSIHNSNAPKHLFSTQKPKEEKTYAASSQNIEIYAIPKLNDSVVLVIKKELTLSIGTENLWNMHKQSPLFLDPFGSRTEVIENFDSVEILQKLIDIPYPPFEGLKSTVLWFSRKDDIYYPKNEKLCSFFFQSVEHPSCIIKDTTLNIEIKPSMLVLNQEGENFTKVSYLVAISSPLFSSLTLALLKTLGISLSSCGPIIATMPLEISPLILPKPSFERPKKDNEESPFRLRAISSLTFPEAQTKSENTEKPFLMLLSPQNPSEDPLPSHKRGKSDLKQKQHVQYSNLCTLPDPVLIRIMQELPLSSLFSLSLVCHRFSDLTREQTLWMPYFFKRFAEPEDISYHTLCDIDYRKAYERSLNLWNNWSKGNFKVLNLPNSHTSTIRTLQFLSTSSQLITGGSDRKLKFWNYSAQKRAFDCTITLTGPNAGVVTAEHFGSLVRAGFRNGTMKAWDSSSWDSLWEQQLVSRAEGFLFLTPKVVFWDNDIQLWDEQTAQRIKTFDGHARRVTCVKLWNQSLVSSSLDKSIRAWDSRTRTATFILKSHTAGVNHIEVFREHFMASSGNDRVAKVWDLRMTERSPFITLTGHVSPVKFAKYHLRRLVTGSDDHSIRFWDIFSSPTECIHRFEEHTSPITCLDFDEQRLFSGSSDGVVQYFDFDL